MKFETNIQAKGKLSLNIIRKGKVIEVFKDISNMVLNGGMLSTGAPIPVTSATIYASTSTALNYEDLPGTWNQSGNTITRATGAGTFPSSPTHIGNELYWFAAGGNTGHRCHVTARASDTSITVSGVAKSITGGQIRRFLSNVSSANFTCPQNKNASGGTNTNDAVAGTYTSVAMATFDSATSAYVLGSVIIGNVARVVLPSTVSIDVDDQIQLSYTIQYTYTNRIQTYELGAESSAIPTKYGMLSVVGNGTYVDVTFSAATHFLAGDKLDLRGLITKKVAISSASSTSTTFTINTATAHSLNPGDSVTIEDASLAGYNGVHTVATTPTGTQFTITNAANPGAMGAAGTCRLTNPSGYYNTLGLATIASMQSGATVARITSTVTGPAVNPVNIGGDPGVDLRYTTDNPQQGMSPNHGIYFSEANVKALPAVNTYLTNLTGSVNANAYTVLYNGAASNDWTYAKQLTWNAGTGTGQSRIKQVAIYPAGACINPLLTFNTPVNKTIADRLRVTFFIKSVRDLDLTGL